MCRHVYVSVCTRVYDRVLLAWAGSCHISMREVREGVARQAATVAHHSLAAGWLVIHLLSMITVLITQISANDFYEC